MCPSGSKPLAVLQAVTIIPMFGNLNACCVDGKVLRLLPVKLHIPGALSPREGLRLVGAAQGSLFC